MTRSLKRIVVALVEGLNDAVFVKEILLKSFGNAYIKEAELANLYRHVRVALHSDRDQVIVMRYAEELGYINALRVAATLCGQAVSSKDVAKTRFLPLPRACGRKTTPGRRGWRGLGKQPRLR